MKKPMHRKSIQLSTNLYVHLVACDDGSAGYLYFHDRDGKYVGDLDRGKTKKLTVLKEWVSQLIKDGKK